ncbi:MAG: hypothetical protein KDA80_15330 [Planctomycetaceae bacterium]|nr:hypothetical protein [Planctomycetaceae bacterium]
MSRLAKIQERLAAEPNDAFLNYSYAMELSKAGEMEQARQAFARVRQIDANYVPAYFQEGQMLAGQGFVPEAQQILREGIAVAKLTGDTHALGEMTEFLDSLT